MGRKLACPGCGTYGSDIASAVDYDQPCPLCGLAADVILRVNEVRNERASESLRAELSEALLRVGKAEASARKADELVYAIREALDRYDGKD